MTLEQLLNLLIEKWWKQRGMDGMIDQLYLETRDEFERKWLLDLLCSLNNWLWQFVCKKKLVKDNWDFLSTVQQYFDENDKPYITDIPLPSYFHEEYRIMLSSIQEDKEKFLLDNIKI
jgi:hypothetical protein